MKKFFILFLLLIPVSAFSQAQLIINVHERDTTSLNGTWKYIMDPYENGYYNYRYQPFDEQENPSWAGYFMDAKTNNKSDLLEYDWDNSPTIKVPGDWNHQEDKFEYYEGSVWYRKVFSYEKSKADNRVFLHFGGANYEAHVYLNGKKLGVHVGGFTPFQYEVTDLLKDENSLVLMVNNNRHADGVPTLNTDWWNYGGITRDVLLFEENQAFVSDYLIQLDPANHKSIKGFVHLEGELVQPELTISIPGLNISETFAADENGKAAFNINAEDLDYWSPENPKLYDVKISHNGKLLQDKIGFRTIRTEGSKILLNDEQVYLKGISIHEENPYRVGRANSREDAELLLGWAKELGCNYVRLAHYPHNEHMIEVANEIGLMVWEEIPVYWTIQWENEETFQNAEDQLSAMMNRDKNSAATIIWSLANETPVSEMRNDFLFKLAKKARTIDNTRLLSAAMETHSESDAPLTQIVEDKLAEVVDLVSFNQYLGWYNGLPDKANQVDWVIPYDKPVIISEFGAGALAGFHGDSLTRWSEEYQADTYVQNLNMIKNIPNIAGISPWILVDFRSPRRHLSNIQDGWNRKGVISSEGEKKQAFFVLQEFFENNWNSDQTKKAFQH
ncbi:MAG: glycoside hydrolase family 2 TIM barrel-domain containing protein [Balneolaceae bacterium]